MAAKSYTQQGITALKDGNKAEARRLLKQAIQENKNDITAWLYLSAAVENDRDKTKCMETVLSLDPENATAQRGLAKLKANSPQSNPSTTDSDPSVSRVTTSNSLPDQDWLEPLPQKNVPPPEANGTKKTTTGYKKENRPPRSPVSRRRTWIIIGSLAVVLLCVSCFAFSALSGTFNFLTSSAPPAVAEQTQVQVVTETIPVNIISTPTAVREIFSDPTITPTPTVRPTPTITPTATYIVLGPMISQQMNEIQQEVSDLRGLPVKPDLTSYIVSKDQAEQLLRNRFITADTTAQLEDEKRSLVILGLVNPDYDLENLVLNHLVDNMGGFYLPEDKRIYILGLRFGGLEHLIYSHEFNHALMDQTYDYKQLRNCPEDAQRCQAVTALIEGDATLMMSQWLHQNASPGEINDLKKYHPPALALAEDSPPLYLIKDVNFPYEQGLLFVKTLFESGSWSDINNAYTNPPLSTEQILHPKKYISAEVPQPVNAPAIAAALGDNWKQIASSSLGEWTTYLLLGSGTDEGARVDDTQAKKAAQGWGGDHYQVFYTPSLDKSALAIHWVWDTEKDHQEFEAALTKYLDGRFHGAHKDQPGASCWEENGQTSCFFSQPSRTLWLTAPDLPTLILMWDQYPEFKQPKP
jgi:hypothetical protein